MPSGMSTPRSISAERQTAPSYNGIRATIACTVDTTLNVTLPQYGSSVILLGDIGSPVSGAGNLQNVPSPGPFRFRLPIVITPKTT